MPGIFSFIKRLWNRLAGGNTATAPAPAPVEDDNAGSRNSQRVPNPREKSVDNRPEANEKSRAPMESKCIAVVGLTGSGLSQFIHDVTGEYSDGVAPVELLTPYTTEITPVTACIGEKNVTLIDTPGFAYSSGGVAKNRNKALGDLVSWIKRSGMKLDGIIYMHDIRNKEIYGSKFIPPQKLVESCGYSKMIFVTSRWNEVGLGEGEGRERKFREEFWGFMIEKGSSMKRYGCPEDRRAREILEPLL